MALSADAEFAIKLRQPGWLAGPMQIAVNDQPVTVDFVEKHWLVVRRKWQDGDQLSIRLPMRFSAERFPKASANTFPAAIVYGPVVMACRSPNGNPVSKIDFANLNGNFVPSPGEPLVYHLASAPEVLVRPYYQYKQGERYYLYFDPDHPWTRLPVDQLTFSGEWGLNPYEDLHVTAAPGAYVEAAFTGNRIRWIGRKFDDAGKCEVSVDGEPIATIDQYDPGRDVPFRHELRDLSAGKHTIRLTVLPAKNPASKSHRINLAGFDFLSPISKRPGRTQSLLDVEEKGPPRGLWSAQRGTHMLQRSTITRRMGIPF